MLNQEILNDDNSYLLSCSAETNAERKRRIMSNSNSSTQSSIIEYNGVYDKLKLSINNFKDDFESSFKRFSTTFQKTKVQKSNTAMKLFHSPSTILGDKSKVTNPCFSSGDIDKLYVAEIDNVDSAFYDMKRSESISKLKEDYSNLKKKQNSNDSEEKSLSNVASESEYEKSETENNSNYSSADLSENENESLKFLKLHKENKKKKNVEILPYKCNLCEFSAKTQRGLNCHTTKLHSEKDNFARKKNSFTLNESKNSFKNDDTIKILKESVDCLKNLVEKKENLYEKHMSECRKNLIDKQNELDEKTVKIKKLQTDILILVELNEQNKNVAADLKLKEENIKKLTQELYDYKFSSSINSKETEIERLEQINSDFDSKLNLSKGVEKELRIKILDLENTNAKIQTDSTIKTAETDKNISEIKKSLELLKYKNETLKTENETIRKDFDRNNQIIEKIEKESKTKIDTLLSEKSFFDSQIEKYKKNENGFKHTINNLECTIKEYFSKKSKWEDLIDTSNSQISTLTNKIEFLQSESTYFENQYKILKNNESKLNENIKDLTLKNNESQKKLTEYVTELELSKNEFETLWKKFEVINGDCDNLKRISEQSNSSTDSLKFDLKKNHFEIIKLKEEIEEKDLSIKDLKIKLTTLESLKSSSEFLSFENGLLKDKVSKIQVLYEQSLKLQTEYDNRVIEMNNSYEIIKQQFHAETQKNKFQVETIQNLNQVINEFEKRLDFSNERRNDDFKKKNDSCRMDFECLNPINNKNLGINTRGTFNLNSLTKEQLKHLKQLYFLEKQSSDSLQKVCNICGNNYNNHQAMRSHQSLVHFSFLKQYKIYYGKQFEDFLNSSED